MKKLFVLIVSLMVFITIVSCGQQSTLLVSTSTSTPTAIRNNATSTPIPSQTSQPTFTVTPTEWIKTYPTKQALLIYGPESRNQYTQLFIERGDFYISPYLTLYTDGQLIFGPGVSEKHLSQKESEAILTKLKELGFFALQSAYENNYQSLFYTDSTEPFKAETGSVEIMVNNGKELKTLSYETNNEKYLIQPMKDIIAYLNSFHENGAKPYLPDRLLVGIETEKQLSWLHDATAMPWPSDLTPPSQSSHYDGVFYLEGKEALRLYEFIKKNPGKVFIFEGIKFQVSLRPILPNECHIYHYYELRNEPKYTQPYFSCDGW